MNQEKNYRLCAGKVCVISVNLSNVKGRAFAPTTMSGYAMANAWSLLKALEEHQIRDYVGRNRTALPAGTVPPPIRGMMERRHRTFLPEQMTPQPPDLEGRPHTDPEYSPFVGQHPIPTWRAHQREEPEGPEFESRPFKIEGPGQAPLVTRPAEAFRDFAGTNPEEGFLSPGYEAGAADDSLAATLRRQVGGQQRGERMTGQRHQTIGTQEGVARGMKLRGGARAFEPETIERETHTPEQLEVMRRNEELGALAAAMGIDFTPQEVPPSPEPEEEEPQFRTAGAVARRAGLDRRQDAEEALVDKPMPALVRDFQEEDDIEHMLRQRAGQKGRYDPNWALTASGEPRGYVVPSGEYAKVKQGLAHESLFDVDPRQAQAMAGGDMEQMDFGPEGQPMMGQEGLRQRLFQIAQERARQKYRPEGGQSSEIQAMQAELDRRG